MHLGNGVWIGRMDLIYSESFFERLVIFSIMDGGGDFFFSKKDLPGFWGGWGIGKASKGKKEAFFLFVKRNETKRF